MFTEEEEDVIQEEANIPTRKIVSSNYIEFLQMTLLCITDFKFNTASMFLLADVTFDSEAKDAQLENIRFE